MSTQSGLRGGWNHISQMKLLPDCWCKDHTTLLWRGNDVANNRREAGALLNRRRTRHSASAFASSPTPVPPPAAIPASLKRGRENEEKSKDVEKLTLTISNLRESKLLSFEKAPLTDIALGRNASCSRL